MLNPTLRVAIYARVSGEQQVKDDTIASQLEALAQRVASDGLKCEPELGFVARPRERAFQAALEREIDALRSFLRLPAPGP